MATDWFKEITGFRERSYNDTQRNLEVEGHTLRSKVNGASFVIGELEMPSLAELRTRVLSHSCQSTGPTTVSIVQGDVRSLHADPGNRHALFQVASQFNLLEMTGPDITPEDGVTRYAYDRTQGPACAIAAGAATIYRNYFALVDGQHGQTRSRQFDCLKDLGSALGNDGGGLWTMRNGYALCDGHGLELVHRRLEGCTDSERDALKSRLRIGVQWGVQITSGTPRDLHVSQAFCSALPVSYTPIPSARWELFARLVLEATYEATLWAAVLNARRFGSNVVFLTHVGGGAFGNERTWINDAISRTLVLARSANAGLDARIVSYGAPTADVVRLVDEFR